MLGPTKGAGMDYRLYRADERGRQRAVLGQFADYGAALVARDDDALAQLADAAGRRVTARHVIVGPGTFGPRTAHPVTTAFGADDVADVELELAVADARNWLAGIRERGSASAADDPHTGA
jgi:hypothetical protein